jgi:hypothetical protein
VVDESEVETGVVGHEHRAAEELEEGGEDRLHRRRAAHGQLVDPGEVGDEPGDRHTGIDQALEGPEALAPSVQDRADLGDPGVGGRPAGGLEVHAGEHHLGEGDAEVLEARLCLCLPLRRHGRHRSPPR